MNKICNKFNINFEVTLDQYTPGWTGNLGMVTTLLTNINIKGENTITFICGPEIMIRFSTLQLMAYGIKPEKIFLSLERNMQCAEGYCGHCLYGKFFVCKDGPVIDFASMQGYENVSEL